MTTPADASVLIERWTAAKSTRMDVEVEWNDAYAYCIPVSGGSAEGESGSTAPINGTSLAQKFTSFLAGFLASSTVSQSSPWFRLSLADDESAKDDVNFLDEATHVLHSEINSSNFLVAYLDSLLFYITCGNLVMHMTQDGTNLVYKALDPRNVWWDVKVNGDLDTVYRLTSMTSRQVLSQFPEATLPSSITDDLQRAGNTKHQILNVIYRRSDVVTPEELVPADKMPYASVWILVKDSTVLEESGYMVMPVYVSQFYKTSVDGYGAGPGILALPDLRQISQTEEFSSFGIETVLQPPLFLSPDASLNQDVSLSPGAINYMDMQNNHGPVPYVVDPRGIELAANLRREKEESLKGTFFINFFLSIQQEQKAQPITATEAAERVREKTRIMMSILSRLEHDLFKGMIENAFLLLSYYGHPSLDGAGEMGGRDFQVEFSSGATALYRKYEEQELIDLVQQFGQLSQIFAQLPAVGDVVDSEKLLRAMLQSRQLPPGVIRSPAEVQKIRQTRMLAQQKQLQEQQIQDAIKPIDPQKAPEEGSMMDQMQNGPEGGPQDRMFDQ